MKLRLWICDWGGGRMEYDGFGVNEKGEVLFLDEGVYHKGHVNNQTRIVMQYTGLKDRNGKEIYEGDIISSPGRIASVIYMESECGFYARTKTGNCDDVVLKFSHNSLIEVIGNIYENPDLIK